MGLQYKPEAVLDYDLSTGMADSLTSIAIDVRTVKWIATRIRRSEFEFHSFVTFTFARKSMNPTLLPPIYGLNSRTD